MQHPSGLSVLAGLVEGGQLRPVIDRFRSSIDPQPDHPVVGVTDRRPAPRWRSCCCVTGLMALDTYPGVVIRAG
jgi:hypothetical protein